MIAGRVFVFLGFLLLLFSSAFGQHVEEGWRGLLPFQSTKVDVERLFGEGKKTGSDRYYQFEYKTLAGTFRVDYSGERCNPSAADPLDKYDLPVATILRYEVRLATPVALSEFTFDVNRFRRDVTIYGPDNKPARIAYLQWEYDIRQVDNEWRAGNGIEIWVIGDGDRELVTGFLYSPPYDRTKFKCSDL